MSKLKAAVYSTLVGQKFKNNGDEPWKDSENPRAFEQRLEYPVTPDQPPKRNPESAYGNSGANSCDSSTYNRTWDRSSQPHSSQGQHLPPAPNYNGNFPTRAGHCAQQYPDPYGAHYPQGGPPNIYFPIQPSYEGASQLPSGHHQYPSQDLTYNHDLHANPIQNQDYQQQYSGLGQPFYQDNRQQMYHSLAQEINSQLYAENQPAMDAGPDTLRRASTTPVPDSSNQCRHGTLVGTWCGYCADERSHPRRQTGL